MHVGMSLQQYKGPHVHCYLFYSTHFLRFYFFLPKMSLRFSDLKIWIEFLPLLWGEKNDFFTNLDFNIRKPYKIVRVPCFFFPIIESKHPLNTIFQGKNISNYIIWTVSTQILSLFIFYDFIWQVFIIFFILFFCCF